MPVSTAVETPLERFLNWEPLNNTYSVFVLANKEPFMDASIFHLGLFWAGQKSVLPHYALWLAEVGCAKVASANVEVVFSGAGRIAV